MNSNKTNNKNRIETEVKIAISKLRKQNGINEWVLLGGGRVQKSARSDEFDVNILAVALEDGKFSKEISKEILVPLGALGIIRPREKIIQNRFGGLYLGCGRNKNKDLKLIIKNPGKAIIVEGSVLAAGHNTPKSLAPLENAPYVELDAIYKGKSYKCYISCLEAFRFYYGSSNGLLNACLADGTAEDLIFNPTVDNNIESKPYIQLRKNLYDVDSLAAARICFDIYAKTAFENIKSQTKHVANSSRWVKCVPPIHQSNVKWQVSGREIAQGKILISNIFGCGANLPVKNLVFGRDNDGRTVKGVVRTHVIKNKLRSKCGDKPNGGDNDSKSNLPEKYIGGDESIDSPNVDIETETLDYSDYAGQFTGLNDVKIEKINKVEIKSKTKTIVVYHDSDIGGIRKLATSKAHGKLSKVGKINIVANKSNGTKPKRDEGSRKSFSEVLFPLQNLKNINISPFMLKGYEYEFGSPLCIFPFGDEFDKKGNEFNLLYTTFLEIEDKNSNVFKFGFVEFFDRNKLLESRSCLLMNLTGYNRSDIQSILIAEVNEFRSNGKSWSTETVEMKDSKVSLNISRKHRLVHSDKSDNLEDLKKLRLRILNRLIKFEPNAESLLLKQFEDNKPDNE